MQNKPFWINTVTLDILENSCNLPLADEVTIDKVKLNKCTPKVYAIIRDHCEKAKALYQSGLLPADDWDEIRQAFNCIHNRMMRTYPEKELLDAVIHSRTSSKNQL